MSDAYDKFCMLMALSNLSQKDIMSSVSHATSDKEDFLNKISFFREEFSHYIANSTDVDFLNSSRKNINTYNYTIINKISKLLRDESRYTVAEAAQKMLFELYEQYPNLPPLNRQSFKDWLRIVSEIVPESELLHIATRIRNNAVHDNKKLDWNLK